MIKLFNWHLDMLGGWFAHGIVKGHDRLPDGTYIYTSVLESIDLDSENKRLVLLTHSQNTYYLDWKDINLNAVKETKGVLAFFDISDSFISECEVLKQEVSKGLLSKASSILGNSELLYSPLEKKAFYKNSDGDVREVEVSVHVGTFQDSVIIWDLKKHQVDFRYFPKGICEDIFEPYHWSDGLNAVVIDNNLSTDIVFKGSNGKRVECKSGSVTRLESGIYTGEGLFSPDIVNGKSVLVE